VRTLAAGATTVLACTLVATALTLPGGSLGRATATTASSGAADPVAADEGAADKVAADEVAAANDAERLLAVAVRASQSVTHRGRVTIVSLGESGPQVTELAVVRDAGEVRVEQLAGGHLDHAATRGGTRATERLLRVAGLGDAPDQLGLLDAKYVARTRGKVSLDTGPAAVVEFVERSSGIRRELLYLDAATGLVVRRETFARTGAPVRVVAYVALDTTPHAARPGSAGAIRADDDLERVGSSPQPVGVPTARDAAPRLRAEGYVVPHDLGAGYRLLAAHELALDDHPAVHLLYGDGLYTLSLFQQRGRLATGWRREAVALATQHGGTVWRWPGSEPRHVVWTGDELTFTALTDAPADELLAAIGALPNDPPASALGRVARGFQRVGRWLAPGGDDDLEGARRDLRP
jgi:hypothetical protein